MIIQLLNLEFTFFILRIVVGVFFAVHGYPKLFKDFRGTAGFLNSLGFAGARFWAIVLGSAEFFGGILLITGLWTQAVASILVVAILVALFRVRLGRVNFTGGWELEFLVLGILLALVFGLPGGATIIDIFRQY